MSGSPKIGVAILQWGRPELTANLLDNLIVESEYVRTIVVCDNGSLDADYAELINYFEVGFEKREDQSATSVTVLRNQNNSGFAAGMNLAIETLLSGDVDWVWVLNNDISFSLGTVQQLTAELNDATPAVYGCRMREAEAPEFTGFLRFNFFTTRHHPIKSVQQLTSVSPESIYVCGANMIIHRQVFESVGLLNQRSFLYFEELDFVYRARAKRFEQALLKGPVVHHIGAASSNSSAMSGRRIYHETWSMLDFYWHHKVGLYFWLLLVRMPIRLITLLVSRRGALVPYLIRGVVDFLRRRNGDLKAAKVVESTSYFVGQRD